MAKTGEAFTGSREERVYDLVMGGALAVATAPLVLPAAAAISLDPSNKTHQPFYFSGREGGSAEEQDWLDSLKISGDEDDLTLHDEVMNFIDKLPEGGVLMTKLWTVNPQKTGWNATVGSNNPAQTALSRTLHLRQLGIDDATGFWDVIMGKYSLVGRRGILLKDHALVRDMVGEATHDEWLKVPLGALGQGQNARHEMEDPMSKAAWQIATELDIEWSRKASIKVNTQVIGKTPRAVIKGALWPDLAEDYDLESMRVNADPNWLTSTWFKEEFAPQLIESAKSRAQAVGQRFSSFIS